MSLKCSGLYLSQFRINSAHLLASGDGTKNATVVGNVYVHPSAKVHPTAKVVPLPYHLLPFVLSLFAVACIYCR